MHQNEAIQGGPGRQGEKIGLVGLVHGHTIRAEEKVELPLQRPNMCASI